MYLFCHHVMQYKRQNKENISNICSANSGRSRVFFAQMLENCGKVWCYRDQAVMNTSKAAKLRQPQNIRKYAKNIEIYAEIYRIYGKIYLCPSCPSVFFNISRILVDNFAAASPGFLMTSSTTSSNFRRIALKRCNITPRSIWCMGSRISIW